MAEPTLQEIESFSKDPDLVKGSPAVVYDISAGLKGVWEAAHSKAQYDWQKYQTHLKQLSDYAANHQLDFAGVMQEDIPAIEKASQDYWKKVSENPKRLTQIGQDGEWSKIQGMIAKSKQDNSLLQLQEKFRDQHPDLLNEKNNQIALDYRKSGLQRNASQLQWDLPKTIDLGSLANTDLERTATPATPIIRKIIDPETGVYTGSMEKVEGGVNYDKNKYKELGSDLYNSNQKIDAYGHTVKEAAQDMFDRLSADEKKKYKTPLEFWNHSWEAYYKDKGGKETSARVEDKAFDRETQKLLQESKGKQEIYLKYLESSLRDKNIDQSAEGLVKLTHSILNNTTGQIITVQTDSGYKNEENLQLSPEVLKIFGKTGKRITEKGLRESSTENIQYPDEVTKTEDGQLRPIYWLKKDGKVVKDKNRNPIYESGAPITENELMLKLARESGEGKVSLDVVNKADNIFKDPKKLESTLGKKIESKKSESKLEDVIKKYIPEISESELEDLRKKYIPKNRNLN